jgi:transposase
MSKKQRKATFNPYNPDQLCLLPPSLDDLITASHVVRVVRDVIDRINIDSILKKYKGGGASSFQPKMMLKIIVYGDLSNTYSSHKI